MDPFVDRQLAEHVRVVSRGVLVVEDGAADLHLLKDALSDLGIEGDAIICAGSLAEARVALIEHAVNCILVDLTLPDAQGLEAVAVLSAAAPSVPLIVVTGQPADTLVYAALAEGADEYLEKRSLSSHALGDVLSRAVQRRRGRGRHGSDAMAAALALDELDTPTAAVDGSGRITAVNKAWERNAAASGAGPGSTGVGVSYLAVCAHAAGAFSEGAADAAAGIRSVLSGETDAFSMDYPCPSNGVERWFTMRVTPLGELGGGALITHLDITRTKLIEDRVRQDNVRLHTMFHESAPIFALINRSGAVEVATATTTDLLGLHAQRVIDGGSFDRIHPEDAAGVQQALSDVARTPGGKRNLLIRARDPGGRWRDLDVSCVNMLDDDAVGALVVTGSDVTESRRIQIATRLESRLLRGLPAAVIATDERDAVVYFNRAAEETFGFDARDALGRHISDLNIGPREAVEELMAFVERTGRWEGDYDARRADGSIIPLHTILERVDDPAIGFHGILGASIDVSERRKLEQDLAFQALHDPLTELPNRRLFIEHLEGAVARSEASGSHAAVLFVDLDDFKMVNDLTGHETGDQVLKEVGARLRQVMRRTDVVARLGGDEFVVCCEGVDGGSAAMEAAQRVQQVLGEPLLVDSHLIHTSASIGVALSWPGTGAEAVLRNADIAMYAAKDGNKGRIEFFDDGFREAAKERARAASELAAALDAGDISAWFQPCVSLQSGWLFGFEALARWHRRDGAIVPPGEFIALAEASGLIDRLGERMLSQACAFLARLMETCPHQPVRVTVNISAHQLLNPAFAAVVRSVVSDHRVPPGRLTLEVTESTLIDRASAIAALRRLKTVGVQIAVDDFGTGYSSLSRLSQFPVDHLKIDHAFVQQMSQRPEATVIVTAVVGLARTLGLHTVAEGIENEAQLRQLQAIGCDVGQGFFWSAAMPADDAIDAARNWVTAIPLLGISPSPGATARDRGAPELDARAAVALLAHQFAEPIAILDRDHARLSDEPSDELDVPAATRIRGAVEQARRALHTISDVAALEYGTLDINITRVNVRDVIDEVLDIFTDHIEDRLTLDVEASIYVDADRDRLATVIGSLIGNALRHAPPPAPVRISAAPAGEMVRITVADGGPGIAPEHLGVLFRRFGRIDANRGGNGLGLYLARGIVRAHGGELTYRAGTPTGAVFTVELPAMQSRPV